MTGRASVRGVVIDQDNRVLLVKWRRPADGTHFWLCPGGGVEDGEDDVACLTRELAEETGLSQYDLGAHVATWHWSNGYQHRFYVVRCEHFDAAPGAGHPNYEVFDEYRWCRVGELPPLTPDPGLPDLLASVLGGDAPESPTEWFEDPSDVQ